MQPKHKGKKTWLEFQRPMFQAQLCHLRAATWLLQDLPESWSPALSQRAVCLQKVRTSWDSFIKWVRTVTGGKCSSHQYLPFLHKAKE